MDFDSDLTQIQGALIEADKTYIFDTLTRKEDNEDEIISIIKTFHTILSEKSYINGTSVNPDHQNALRKITLFLIFNSDLRILSELVNYDDIGHLIWVAPTIPKYLLFRLIWGLNLETFYCEAITYCTPKLSLELLRVGTQNLKETSPETSINNVNVLIPAIYSATHRMLTVREGFHKFILNGYYESMYELLKYYLDPPNKWKMKKWDIEKQFTHIGYGVYNLFEIMIDCFHLFLNKNIRAYDKDFDIFTVTNSKSGSDSASENPERVDFLIKDSLKNFNLLLIETMRENIFAIDVDIYCSWSEFSHPKQRNKTIQKAIGESAHRLYSLITSEPCLNSDAASLLVSISCKPLELADIIKAADKTQLLEKSGETSEDQKEWLKELSKRDYFFDDRECLARYSSFVNVLNDATRVDMFERSVDKISKSQHIANIKEIKSLANLCFSLSTNEYKKIALSNVFTKIPLGSFLEPDDFDDKLREQLNKFIKIDEDVMSAFYCFFAQNPFKFLIRIFERCSRNSQALDLLEAVNVFKSMSSIQYEEFDPSMPQVTDITGFQLVALFALKQSNIVDIETEAEKASFVELVKEAYYKKILPHKTIVFRYLMDGVDVCLATDRVEYSLLFLKGMREVYDCRRHPSFLPPLILRIGQILELGRWNLETYSITLVELVETTTGFLESLIEEYVSITPKWDREYLWLVSGLGFLSPLNALYFKKLFPSNVIGPLLEGVTSNVLPYCLCYLIPRSTLIEWRELFNEMKVANSPILIFGIFCDTICLVASTAVALNTGKSYACVENCCRNLAIVLQEMILPIYLECEKEILMKDFVVLLNTLPQIVSNNCFNAFLRPLSLILESYSNDISDTGKWNTAKVVHIIQYIQNDSFKSILIKLTQK